MSEFQLPNASKISAFQMALLAFTIFVLVALVADTTMALPKDASDLISILDTFSCGVFFIDFCVRFFQAESKLAFMKWGWIDLIACIPNLELFRWARLVRVLRVIRLLRGIRSVQKALALIFQNKIQGGIASVSLSAFLLVAFSSVSILVCERQNDSNIKTAEDALWWSVTTFTTVGYGDKYPITTEGRALGMALMIAGVGIFGALSGLAASFFLGHKNQKTEPEELLAQMKALQDKLDTLLQDRQSERIKLSP